MSFLSHFNAETTNSVSPRFDHMARYDFNGRYDPKNGSLFDPDNKEYRDTFILMLMCFGLATLALYFLSCIFCSMRWMCFSKSLIDSKNGFCKVFLLFGFSIGIGLIIFGVLEAFFLKQSGLHVLHANDINAERLYTDTLNMSANIQEINQTTIWIYTVNINSTVNTTLTNIEDGLHKYLHKISPTGQTVLKSLNATVFVSLSFFGLLGVLMLVVILFKLKSGDSVNTYCLSGISGCAMIFLPLLFLGFFFFRRKNENSIRAGCLFVSSVFVNDACPQYEVWIQNHTNAEQYQAFIWYTSCPSNPNANPLGPTIEVLTEQINNLTIFIDKARQQHLDPMIPKLVNLQTEIMNVRADVIDFANCTNMAKVYRQEKSVICDESVGGLFILCLVYILVCIVFLFLFGLALFFGYSTPEQQGYLPIN